MFWKKGLGIGLSFTGVYLILTNAALTGAVIGFGEENLLGLPGILVLVAGIVMILGTKTLERRVKKELWEEDKHA